jgi:hypothetical protein
MRPVWIQHSPRSRKTVLGMALALHVVAGTFSVPAAFACSVRFVFEARSARCSPGMLQRPFLPALLWLPKPCTRSKGEICAAGFGLSAFGFLFSRLPLCCFFATSNLPCKFEVTDAGPYLVYSPPLAAERRTKSSSTAAINIFLRASCAVAVDAKRPSR